MRIEPAKWTGALRSLREQVETMTDAQYDAVFLNLYRDGRDSIDWHADDDHEVPGSPIASLSLGAPRDFLLRRIDRNPTDQHETIPIELRHGDLLVMRGNTQTGWQHAVPPRKGVTLPRLSLTFRRMRQDGSKS